MKKRITIAMVCAMTATLAACDNSSSSETGSTRSTKVVGYIEDYDFETAYNYYVEHIAESRKKDEIDADIEDAMNGVYDSVLSKYSSGVLDDSDISYIKRFASEASFYSTSEYSDFIYNIGVIESSSTAYENGLTEFTNGNYDAAISYFEMVDPADSVHYSDAQSKKAECETMMTSEQSETIQAFIKDGEYENALSAIDDLSATNPTLAETLRTEFDDTVSADIDAKVNKYFEAFDYDGAYSYLNGLYSSFGSYGSDYLDERINHLEDDFVTYSLSTAEDDASDNNFEAASAVVQQAIGVVGEDNERLNSAFAEYRSHLPVYIVDLDYMSCENRVITQDTLKDNVGNLYHNGMFMAADISFIGDGGWYGAGSATYYIQNKYALFTGTVAVPDGLENIKRSAYFEVYGDGNLLYTSPVMTNTSFPEKFSIDISGVKVLEISYPASNDRSAMATIYDGQLLPTTE